jgi:hypothetical protein
MKWRASGVAQVVEHLPSKCEALNSIPSTEKKKKVSFLATFVAIPSGEIPTGGILFWKVKHWGITWFLGDLLS